MFARVIGGYVWFSGGRGAFIGGASIVSGGRQPFTGGHTPFTGERVTNIKTRTVKQLNNHDKKAVLNRGNCFYCIKRSPALNRTGEYRRSIGLK
ncbi:hypothetical protein [Fictibacillus phosphorivorans]|uniref:hypothetical protein n=1 Tax=Fictibacillus phosphorivorans TaxID=1221500 RepID=UPI00129378C7|nr:hypothetical protein [Fictibacillus phosphorivorans]MQR94669.1 hypothetical protein [Fictibacillus phosphorivorans]